jgi:hypothetical protein
MKVIIYISREGVLIVGDNSFATAWQERNEFVRPSQMSCCPPHVLVPPLQTLFLLLLSPDILELIFMLHFLEFFQKDIFTIDGFLCWQLLMQIV